MNMRERIAAINCLQKLVEQFEDEGEGGDGFLDMDTNSPCGVDCCIVLDEFAVLIQRYPDIEKELFRAVYRLLSVYYFG